MNYFLKAITLNYFNYQGRARRTEFGMFCLFYCLINLAFLIFLSIIMDPNMQSILGLSMIAVNLYLLIPFWTISIRRFHDTGQTGLFALFYFAIGFLLAIILIFVPGEQGHNKYGPDPKTLDSKSIP